MRRLNNSWRLVLILILVALLLFAITAQSITIASAHLSNGSRTAQIAMSSVWSDAGTRILVSSDELPPFDGSGGS